MFTRVKTTPNSPRRGVQVVESSRVGATVKQKIVRYMGIALDDAEEAKLRTMAQEFIEQETRARLNGTSLFAVDALPRRAGRPARQTLESALAPEDVRLSEVQEVARRVEGPHEVLGHLYDYLGFDRVLGGEGSMRGATLLRDLVIARVTAPDSKRANARDLSLHYGREHSLDSLYRLMDRVHERLDGLKQVVLQATARLTGGTVQMMLFDVTTLYFESVAADELRAFGYSKDQKYHCTQVVLALATVEEGLPIGYELFAGNTAEVKTLIGCMQRWQLSLNVNKVSFVADRALCSRANLATLEQAPWQYVVAMPLRRSLKAHQQAQILRTALAAPIEVEGDLVWVIEESFRTIKHSLAVRPIYHFKPERIQAHIGICYLAFALARHAQQRIKLAQQAMSVERISAALHGVQASILEHTKTHAKYRMPSVFSQDAARIYKAFGLKRDLAPSIDLR